jgi:hypothetical protein
VIDRVQREMGQEARSRARVAVDSPRGSSSGQMGVWLAESREYQERQACLPPWAAWFGWVASGPACPGRRGADTRGTRGSGSGSATPGVDLRLASEEAGPAVSGLRGLRRRRRCRVAVTGAAGGCLMGGQGSGPRCVAYACFDQSGVVKTGGARAEGGGGV